MTFLTKTVAAAAVSLAGTLAQASTLTLETSLVLELESGSDDEGLANANVLISMVFDEGAAFTQTASGPGERLITSDTTTITISGAANASDNGVFETPAPLSVYYTLGILLSDGPVLTTPSLPGIFDRFSVGFNFSAPDFPEIGDTLTLSDLQALTGPIAFGSVAGYLGTTYEIDDSSSVRAFKTPAAVPLPAAGAVLLLGLGGLGMMRRRA